MALEQRTSGLLLRFNENSVKTGAGLADCPAHVTAEVLSSRPFLIKPNLEEFQEMTKGYPRTIGDVISRSRKFLEQVSYLCVSSVEGGALLITREEVCFGRIPKVQIRSSVGAGDSMVGAMVGHLHKGFRQPREILRWGLAAAAATLQTSGTRLGSAKEIMSLYAKTKVDILRVDF